MKPPHAPSAAADSAARIGVHERGEHAALQPHSEMALERQVSAAAGAHDEPDLVVTIGRIPREPDHPGQEGTRASDAEILTAPGEVLIDDDPHVRLALAGGPL